MNKGRNILASLGVALALAVTAFIVHSCGIYSFTGTSIQPDVKTVTINYFEYQALKVNPSLSSQITEALQESSSSSPSSNWWMQKEIWKS